LNYSPYPIGFFLLVTFVGIFIYLIHVYRIWRETTIGLWGIATALVSVSVVFHLLSLIFLNEGDLQLAKNSQIFALSFSFAGFWCFGISHLLSRRNFLDSILLITITVNLAILLNSVRQINLDLKNVNDVIIIGSSFSLTNRYDQLLLLFFINLYVILARDSEMIYRASKRNKFKEYSRAMAWTHLLAWQFWVLGMILLNIIRHSLGVLQFSLPFILLLVPLITLGSRPFDWVREGFEPIIILLLDKTGNSLFSWTINNQSPFLLEGSAISSVEKILSDFANQTIDTMQIHFTQSSLYVESSTHHLSLLLTTGHHKAFSNLLEKIHQIMIKAVTQPVEFGVSSFELPQKLKWLLKQLLPTSDLVNSDIDIKELLTTE